MAAERDETRQREDGRTVRARKARQARRAQVLKAALSVFVEKGYHRASISEIIERAGIARGTFYLYFKNKRAIFEELLSSFLDRIFQSVQRVQVSPNAAPPVHQLRDNVRRVIDLLVENRDFTRLLLRQAQGQDPEFDEQIADFYDRILTLIRGALELGRAMGLVRPCSTRIVSACLLGSVKEVADQVLLDTDLDEEEKNEVVDEILSFGLQGVFAWEDDYSPGPLNQA